MRGIIAVFVAATVAVGGCKSSNGAKESKSAAQAQPAGATKPCVMRAGGQDVLRLTAPADAPFTSDEGALNVTSRDGYVEFWLVADAKSVDQAAARASKVIVSEFKNLNVASTSDLSVAGSPAKRLSGTGVEADDGDPGFADVVVFKVGGRVFVACTHGESMRQSAQRLMMDMVQTAKAP
jgi:hypothetical protein